jgi:hypothetical protein
MTEINRPLTDEERTLMCQLAIASVAQQTGKDRETVADELDAMVIVTHGDAQDAYLEADGKTLVHISRADLALAANHPGETLHAEPIEPTTGCELQSCCGTT